MTDKNAFLNDTFVAIIPTNEFWNENFVYWNNLWSGEKNSRTIERKVLGICIVTVVLLDSYCHVSRS